MSFREELITAAYKGVTICGFGDAGTHGIGNEFELVRGSFKGAALLVRALS